jgi:hypothetical protein
MLTPKETKTLTKASRVIFNKAHTKLDEKLKMWMLEYMEVMEWVADDNVVTKDGYLTTQDSMYRAKIMTLEELIYYYYKHIKF